MSYGTVFWDWEPLLSCLLAPDSAMPAIYGGESTLCRQPGTWKERKRSVCGISHVKNTQMKLSGSWPLANVLEHYSLKKSCSAGGQDQNPADTILDITRQALHQSCFVLALGQSLPSPVPHRHTAFQLIQSTTWEMNHPAIPETRRWLSVWSL